MPLQLEIHLVKSSEFSVAKALLYLQQVNISTTLVLAWSDGSVELRDSQSLEPVPLDGEEQISGLGQVGFTFLANRPCMLATPDKSQ